MQDVETIKFYVYGSFGTGLFQFGHTPKKRHKGVNLRKKTKIYDRRKKWRNEGKKMQLGIGYTVPCNMGRLGQSPHGWATRPVEEQRWVYLVSIERLYEVAGEAPRHRLTKRGSPGHNPVHGWPFWVVMGTARGNIFGWATGAIYFHNTNVQRLFGVVNWGWCVVGLFVQEALQVGVIDILD